MSLEANKTLARRYFEEFLNQGNLCVADEIFDAKVSYRGPFGSIDGVDRLKRFFLMVHKALPDLHYVVEEASPTGIKSFIASPVGARASEVSKAQSFRDGRFQFPELMCSPSATERLLKCAASGIPIAKCSSLTGSLSLQ